MPVNGKIRPVETIPGTGERRRGGTEFNYNI
jgi:hypothetical protein